MNTANRNNRGQQNRAYSRWRELLCTPLLRGRTAEKWAMPFVAYPALAVATLFSVAALVSAPLLSASVMALLIGWQIRSRAVLVNPQFTLSKLPARPVHEFRPLAARSPLAVDRNSAIAEAECLTQLVIERFSNSKQIDLCESNLGQIGGLRHLSTQHKQMAINIPLMATSMPNSNLPAAAAHVALHELGHARQSYLAVTLSGVTDQFNSAALLVCGAQAALSGYIHAGLLMTGQTIPDAFTSPSTALTTLGAAAISFMLSRIFQRQCEYDADRFAVRASLMPHTFSHTLAASSPGEKVNCSPSLISNLFNQHPCPNLRIREILYYGEQLGAETAKATIETPKFLA